MQTTYNFKQSDIVEFSYCGIEGKGEVIGCSLTDLPCIGKHYIVNIISSNINTNDYPFSAISLPEHCLSPLKEREVYIFSGNKTFKAESKGGFINVSEVKF